MEKATGKQIIDEIHSRIIAMENTHLSETVGALNGVDMKTYSDGYCDALRQLKVFFETRV